MANTELQPTYLIPNEITTKELNESYYIARDLVAGTIGGFAICLSGHPFDTIKVRMQMTQLSLSNCIRLSVKNEGIMSFYKGVQSPFYTVPLINAIVFGAYGFCHRLMGQDIFSEFTMKQGLYAGAFAGLVNCIVLSPVELVKCRMQMDVNNQFKGAWPIFASIYKTEGIKGIYRGMVSSMLREMPCYAAQFATYEVTKNYLHKTYGDKNVTLQLLFSGGLAGLMCWVASYPQDVIKTKLQCDYGISDKERQYKTHKILKDGGFIDCAKKIYKSEGKMGFWRGFSACAIRAVIANAVGFFAYEQTKSLFHD